MTCNKPHPDSEDSDELSCDRRSGHDGVHAVQYAGVTVWFGWGEDEQ